MTLQELKTPLITTQTDCDDSVAETVSTSEESSCSSDEEKEEKTSILTFIYLDLAPKSGSLSLEFDVDVDDFDGLVSAACIFELLR